jgi:hypothetical protein
MTALTSRDRRHLHQITAAACPDPACPCEQAARQLANTIHAQPDWQDPSALLLRISAVLALAADHHDLSGDQTAWVVARAAALLAAPSGHPGLGHITRAAAYYDQFHQEFL